MKSKIGFLVFTIVALVHVAQIPAGAVSCSCDKLPSSGYAPSAACETVETAKPSCYLEWYDWSPSSDVVQFYERFAQKIREDTFGQLMKERFGETKELIERYQGSLPEHLRSAEINRQLPYYAFGYLARVDPANYDGRLVAQSVGILLGARVHSESDLEATRFVLQFVAKNEDELRTHISSKERMETTIDGVRVRGHYGCVEFHFGEALKGRITSVMFKTSHTGPRKGNRC